MGVVFANLSVCRGPVVFVQDRATSYAWVLQTSRDCCIPVSSGLVSGVWCGPERILEGVAARLLVYGHGVFGIMAPVVGW